MNKCEDINKESTLSKGKLRTVHFREKNPYMDIGMPTRRILAYIFSSTRAINDVA